MSRDDFREVKNVHIDDIFLDQRNPRIRSATDLQSCINRILRGSGAEKVLQLISHIAKNGLSTAPILVTKCDDDSTKYVVKDGNRRITALKLMNNTALCPDRSLRDRIIKLISSAKYEINNVDCLYSDNNEAIKFEIRMRHGINLGGAAQIDWSSYMRTIDDINNNVTAEYKISGKYLLWAEENGIDVDDEFPITTIHRFLNHKTLEILGFKLENDNLVLVVQQDHAYLMASKVIRDFWTKNMRVDNVFTKEKAEIYLKEVRQEVGLEMPTHSDKQEEKSKSRSEGRDATSQQESDHDQDEQKSSNAKSGDAGRRSRTPNKPTWDRQKLFTRACPSPALPTSENKARTICYEIMQIKDVQKCPLTAAFLIRALVERSVDYYITNYKMASKQKLAEKMASVCDSMLNKGKLSANQVSIIKLHTTSDKSNIGFLHIDTLQKYLHKETHFPTAQIVNTTWDELGHFIHLCWR